MAKNRSRSLAAIALAVTTSIGMTGTVVAQDPECAVGLWSLPIEAVTPPEGWDWSSLFPTTDGGWWGGFSTAEPAEEFEATDETYGSLSFSLRCSLDSAAFMAAELRTRERSGYVTSRRDLPVSVPLGDEAWAERTATEYGGVTTINWRNGPVLGQVSAGAEDATWFEIEDLAMTLDALLP
jgi:hypothetical protein